MFRLQRSKWEPAQVLNKMIDRTHLGGAVSVGVQAEVGIGASVIQGVAIGERAVVGAGAVVIGDVAPDTTVVGVPARPIRPSGG